MEENKRIGILLFLFNRNELSPDEETELLNWRRESTANEEVFNQLTDREYIRSMMTEMYTTRKKVFDIARERLPYLSDANLSNADILYGEPLTEEEIMEEEMQNHSENEYLASGFSRVDYWANKIGSEENEEDESEKEDDINEEEIENQSGDMNVFPDAPKNNVFTLAEKIKKPIRYLRSHWRVACMILGAGILSYYLAPLPKIVYHEVGYVSSRSLDLIKDDMRRGYDAGRLGIGIEEDDNGSVLYHIPLHKKSSLVTRDSLYTPSGHKLTMILPDGTKIWLNANSAVIYPENLAQDPLMIEVYGEVFFEIAAKSKKQYILDLPLSSNSLTTESRITDQPWGVPGTRNKKFRQFILSPGTRLNTISFENESPVTASVLSGSLTYAADTGTAMLQAFPGQQLQITDQRLTRIPLTDSAAISSWIKGAAVFRNANIKTIMRSIGRWYRVNIIYKEPLPDRGYYVSIPEEAHLINVLSELEQQGLHFRVTHDQVTVSATEIKP